MAKEYQETRSDLNCNIAPPVQFNRMKRLQRVADEKWEKDMKHFQELNAIQNACVFLMKLMTNMNYRLD